MTDRITVARGDGIGPEIMDACLKILAAAGADLEYDFIEIGEAAYHEGHTSGIRKDDWRIINSNRAFLKAPITTPQGRGYKSLNVTIRKTLGLFANVRPVRSLHPHINTKHPKMDLVIIRENEEDLYAGIEHRQTNEVYQCLKLMSRPGCERIIRYAFEYARHQGRKKVTCMTKDNIMKLTDGLFHDVFEEVKAEYPDLETEHLIIDIGAARLADTPENFDVIVTPNLYGDIVSDIVAQISGSVGLAGSSNVGSKFAMFEAIHGSAPTIAGKQLANPGGILMAAIMMLHHLGQSEVAVKIENAWLATIEAGIATADFFSPASTRQVSTDDFAKAVIDNLGKSPRTLAPVKSKTAGVSYDFESRATRHETKSLDGVDIFIAESNRDPYVLGERIRSRISAGDISLQMITNRGVKVFPEGNPETYCTDHWRCRFTSRTNKTLNQQEVLGLMHEMHKENFEIIKTEMLFSFDGRPGYSLGQGQ